MSGPVAVVGATGYTGRLVIDALLRRGIETVAVGRNPDKLQLLPPDVTTKVADAQDPEAVRAAVEGCRAAVSCVGPFVDLGEPPLRGILAAGAHYIDTTGEQAFMRRVFEDFDTEARERGLALVPAIGFDYVPGDMAAALAARALHGQAERVRIAYSVRKARSSAGTKRTGLRVAALPCLIRQDGRLVEASIGDMEDRIAFPEGESHVALWPGGEVLTVPRHTGARDVAVFMRMPKVMASMARKAKLPGAVRNASEKFVGDGTGGPSPEDRRKGNYTVIADAWGPGGRGRCTVRGHDMYGMTADACAEALARMGRDDFGSVGALAPSEAFDPESFLGALSEHLSWEIEGV